MAVDVSKIPNNNKFDPVREAILDLQSSIEDTGAAIGNGTLTISTSGSLSGSGTFTANQTSNTTITIGIDDSDYLSLSDTGEQTIAGDIVISGDLTVSGTTTYIDTTNLNIGDNIITLNADLPSGTAPTENAGIEINRGSSTNKTFIWNETSDKWTLGSETLVAGTFEGNLTGDVIGNADTASALVAAVNIEIDGAVTGNADFDGSGDITITTSVNHNHDDRYYTETESDNRFVNVDGDTMTDDLNFDSGSRIRLHSGSFEDSNDRYEMFATGDVMFLQYWDNDQGDGTSLQKPILGLEWGGAADNEVTVFGDLRFKSGNVASPTVDIVVIDMDAVNGNVNLTNITDATFLGDISASSITANNTLVVGTTDVYNALPTGIGFETTDNRLKFKINTNGGFLTANSIDDIVLSDSMGADYIPYVSSAGGNGDTVNAVLSQSWLKINSSTLELDWRVYDSNGDETPGVYTAHDIKMRSDGGGFGKYYESTYAASYLQFLHYNSSSDIDIAKIGGTTTGRIRINDTYSLPAGDGSIGQVLTTNGSGDLSWVAAGGPTTSDLQDVTDNGATTTNSITVGGISTGGDVFFNSGGITRIGNGGYDFFINGGVVFRDYSDPSLTNGRIYYEDDTFHFRGGGEGEADGSADTSLKVRSGGVFREVWHAGNDDVFTLDYVTDNGATTNNKITLTYNDTSDPYSPLELRGDGTHTGLYINPDNGSQAHVRFADDGTLKWQIRAPFQDSTDAPLKFYSWVGGNDMFVFNHNGNLTATSFTGDGSALTNVPTTSNLQVVTNNGNTTTNAITVSGGTKVTSSATTLTRFYVENTGNAEFGSGIFMEVKDGATRVGSTTMRIDRTGKFQVFNGGASEALNFQIDENGNASFTGSIYLNRDGKVGTAIDIDHVEDSKWAFLFKTSSVGNDNPSGFWVNADGTPDMRLRSTGGTVTALIDSAGTSYINGGNLAIGATSSSSKLTVASGTPTGAQAVNANTVVAIDSSANQYLEFRTTASNVGIMQGMLFTDNGLNAFIGYKEYTGGTAGTYGEALHLAYRDFSASDVNNGIYFGTSASPQNGVSNVQMFIKGNGMVGIGTDAPTQISSGVPTLTIDNPNSSVLSGGFVYQSNGTNQAYHYWESSYLVHQVQGSGGHTFNQGASVLMRVNGDGNVGIGNTNPDKQLTFVQAADDAIQIRRLTTSEGNPAVGTGISWTWSSTATDTETWAAIRAIMPGAGNTHLTFSTRDGSAATFGERMRIQDDGNVGIGTDSPSYKLEVNGTSYVGGTFYTNSTSYLGGLVRLNGTTSSNSQLDLPLDYGALRWFDGSTFKGGIGTVNWSGLGSGNDLGFYLNTGTNYHIGAQDSPFVTFDSANQRLGIGTDSPDAKLDVAGEIRSSYPSGHALRLVGAGGGNAQIYGTDFYYGMNLSTSITSSSYYLMSLNSGSLSRFYVGNHGKVGIGTDSPTNAKVHIVGDGSYVGNYGYNTLTLEDASGYPGLNWRQGSSNWLVRKSGATQELEFLYSSNASAPTTGTYTRWLRIEAGGMVETINYLKARGVRIGRDFSLSNRATVRLDSNGTGAPADILFGHTPAANESSWTGVYWSLSSRGSSDGNKFHFYRGSGNPTGSSESILMTLDPNLRVGINDTTPEKTLDVNGTFRASSECDLAKINFETGNYHGIRFRDDSNNNKWKWGHGKPTNEFYIYDYTKDGSIFTAKGNGDIYFTPTAQFGIKNTSPYYDLDVTGTIRASGDVIAFSDARVKENVKTIDNALDKVTKLRGVEYNKIGEAEQKIGVIAQEIEKILPQVVQEDKDGMKSVAYGNIVGVLIEAIKEQQKQIDELKTRLDGSTR